MKTLALWSLVLTCLTVTSAMAKGEKAGNGGVVFLCPDRVKLVDYWESEDLLNPMQLGNPNDSLDSLDSLVDTYLNRMEFFDEQSSKSARLFATSVLKDLKALEADPKAATNLVRYTKGPLNFSLDSDEVSTPPGCEKAQAVTQKEPEIDGEKLLTIYRPIWDQMDNEMRVFTIFHENHIKTLLGLLDKEAKKKSTPLEPLKSTRPARLLNQYLGSPRFAQTKSICDYRRAALKFGMIDSDENVYGGFHLVDVSEDAFECDPVTRRPVNAYGAYRYFYLKRLSDSHFRHSLSIKSPVFDPHSSNWISAHSYAIVWNEPNAAPDQYRNFAFGLPEKDFRSESSKRIKINMRSGKAHPLPDGSVLVEGLGRRKNHSEITAPFRPGIDRPAGTATLRVFPDGEHELTVQD
jgi:hypothetical protein